MLEDEDVTTLNLGKYSKVVSVVMWLASFCLLPIVLLQGYWFRHVALLDKTLRRLAETVERVFWLDASAGFDLRYLAQDGYYPNGLACVEIASKIVDALVLSGKQNKSG